MNINPILSRKIKQYRKAVGMTQEEFAAEIGVEPQHISRIERGSKGISLDKLELICRKFNLTMSELMPTEESDDSLKEKWIGEISAYLMKMDTVQVGILRRMIGSMK
jgi:transcriptional regulator with XRE-family HTH domain